MLSIHCNNGTRGMAWELQGLWTADHCEQLVTVSLSVRPSVALRRMADVSREMCYTDLFPLILSL